MDRAMIETYVQVLRLVVALPDLIILERDEVASTYAALADILEDVLRSTEETPV